MDNLKDLDYYKKILKNRVKPSRYKHSLGVMNTCVKLGEIYKVDVDKLAIAGLLHDYAKSLNCDELKQYIIDKNLLVDEYILKDVQLAHGIVGAHLVQTELGIDDIEIIKSIKYHTIGRLNMSLFEKIVFIADYIEPSRDFKGVDEIRKLTFENINEGIINAVLSTCDHLLSKNIEAHPTTLKLIDELRLQQSGDITVPSNEKL